LLGKAPETPYTGEQFFLWFLYNGLP